MALFSDADKPAIVQFMKDYIRDNGYTSAHYACVKWAEANKLSRTWQDDDHEEAFLWSVTALLVNEGKYVRESIHERYAYDYNVLKNPAYYLDESVTKTSKTTRNIAWLALIVSLVSLGKELSKSD